MPKLAGDVTAVMRLDQMKEPKVDFLSYRVRFAPGIKIESPESLAFDTPQFHGTLDQTRLQLDPKARFVSERAARDAIEPLLRAWEIQISLLAGAPVFTFEFGSIRFIDEANPTESGYFLDHGQIELGLNAFEIYRLKKFPPPPTDFASTPDIETLWLRYRMYKLRQEPLQSMAYFCFTVLTARRGLVAAARHFHVEKRVLRKLSEISTTTGDNATARKRTTQLRPPTAGERQWLEAIVPALIKQMGQVAAGAAPPPLQMNSLPKL